MAGFSESLRKWDDDALIHLLMSRPDLAAPAPTSLTSLAVRATNASSLDAALAQLNAFELQILSAVVELAPLAKHSATGEIATVVTGAPPALTAEALTKLAGLALIWHPHAIDNDARPDGWRPAPGLRDVLAPHPPRIVPIRPPTSADANTGTAPSDNAPQASRHEPPSFPSASVHTGRGRGGDGSAEPDGEVLLAVEELVAAVQTLLTVWEDAPAPVLRSGGIGVREVRRAAAALEYPEARTAFVIELASGACLIAPTRATTKATSHAATTEASSRAAPMERAVFTASTTAEEWLAMGLAGQWAELACAWANSDRLSWFAGTRDSRGTLLTPLGPGQSRAWLPRLRVAVLAILHAHPRVALSAEQVLEVLAWRSPRAVPPASAVSHVLKEAGWLGAIGSGALSTFGAALVVAKDTAGLARVVERALPPPVAELFLQGDLTGVVPGRPTPALAHLLRSAAVVESRGGALTVRFTPDSVRCAVAAGFGPEELLAQLGAHSRAGVPQPLEYLIRDAARANTSTEARRRRPVTAARPAAPPQEVAGETERARRARLRALVARLCSGTTDRGEAEHVGMPADVVGNSAHVSEGWGTSEPAVALTRLREAIDSRSEVLIEVISAAGAAQERVVLPLKLDSGRLRALDVAREAELTVAVHRISAVRAVRPAAQQP